MGFRCIHPGLCVTPFPLLRSPFFLLFQVMETKDMLYIVTEFAKNGEMFGELHSFLALVKPCLLTSACSLWGFSVLFFFGPVPGSGSLSILGV